MYITRRLSSYAISIEVIGSTSRNATQEVIVLEKHKLVKTMTNTLW